MRALRIGIVGLAVVPFLVAAHGAAAPGSHGRCAVPPSLAAPSLPAPVSVTTRCGVYELARDGGVTRVSTVSTPYPNGTEWWPASGVWLRSAHGRLVVGSGKRTLWRSHRRFSRAYDVGTVAVGRRRLAFSSEYPEQKLYVAPFGGRERLVARHEFPLGWTSGGFYTWGRAHHRLELRSPDGAFRKTIEPSVFAYAYGDHGLWIVRRGSLLRANGARVRRIAALSRLGLWPARHIQVLPLDRLVGLETARRLVVLRLNGSLLSSTRLLLRARSSDSMSGQPVASPKSGDVVFADMRPLRRIVEQRFERGVETVYLLRPGARAAVPIHTQEMKFNVCGHGATLAWRGDWLLYSVGEGPAALIDTRTGRSLGLTSVVRRLPGFSGVEENGPLSLAWS